MSYIEVTGKTEEEAVRKALTQLGLERDDVSLEILERAKSGFLGIGGSPARIRVTYGTDEPEEKKAEPAKKVEKKPEPKAEVKKPEVKPEPKKQEPKKPETKPVEKAPEQKPVTVGTCDDDNARRIREFLEGLLQHMNSPAQVNVVLEEKGRYQGPRGRRELSGQAGAESGVSGPEGGRQGHQVSPQRDAGAHERL